VTFSLYGHVHRLLLSYLLYEHWRCVDVL